MLAHVRDALAADRRALLAVERGDRAPDHGDLARVRQLEAGEQLQERRLARAGRPGHDVEPAGAERAGELLEDRGAAVALGEAASLRDHGRRRRRAGRGLRACPRRPLRLHRVRPC